MDDFRLKGLLLPSLICHFEAPAAGNRVMEQKF